MKFKLRIIIWAILLALSFFSLFQKDRIQVALGIRENVEGNILNQKAPELKGLTWIDSVNSHYSIEDFRGKVVLIEFWSYTCGNATSTLPVVKKWYAKYRDLGFVTLGIHTPEGEEECLLEDLRREVENFEISYPIAADNDYRCWTLYGTQYWPTFYLIDRNGIVRYVKVGEGGYWKTERMIRKLLGNSGGKWQLE